MRAIDMWLIDITDAFYIKRQRKGGNLVAMKVWIAFGILFFTEVQAMTMSHFRVLYAIAFGCMFALLLWARLRDFQNEGHYHENARLMERLNRWALHNRENMAGMRIGFLLLSSFLIVLGLAVEAHALLGYAAPDFKSNWANVLSSAVAWWFMLAIWYADCATHIGPGEFARDKVEKLSGQEQGSEL